MYNFQKESTGKVRLLSWKIDVFMENYQEIFSGRKPRI